MHLRSWLVIGLLGFAACKKAEPAHEQAGSGSADVKTGSGSAKLAYDPWNGPPPGGDTKLGEQTKAIGTVARPAAPVSGLAQEVDVAEIPKATPQAAISGFGSVKESGFRVVYNPSPNTAHEEFRKIFADQHVFEKVAEGLNQTVRLPTVVDINTVDCNTVNAFYDRESKRIIVCYELIDYFLEAFRPHITDQTALGNAVMGAVMFTFFHEAGHGLIDILDIPAVGREEDSVDQLATLILIAAGDEGVAMALSGSHYFKTQQDAGSKMPFSDEHAFDGQRFYNINCLIYGSNPTKYASFVADGQLTEERAARCPEEFRKIEKAWEHLLAPFMSNGAAKNVNYEPSVPVAEAPQAAKTDPWDTDSGSAAAPATVPAVADPPVPADPTPDSGSDPAPAPHHHHHAIPCERVAQKAIELIGAAAEDKAKTMTPDEVAELTRRLEAQLPAMKQQVLSQCAKEHWTDASRGCVIAATSLEAAEKCN